MERLIAEFENELTFKFDKNMPDSLAGLIVDKTIFINAKLPFSEATACLAEEIGHYKTSSDSDITDYSKISNMKEEIKARKWSYRKLVPLEEINKFKNSAEPVFKYDLANELDLPEDVVEEAVEMYRKEGRL